jgi:hypothetical protein
VSPLFDFRFGQVICLALARDKLIRSKNGRRNAVVWRVDF